MSDASTWSAALLVDTGRYKSVDEMVHDAKSLQRTVLVQSQLTRVCNLRLRLVFVHDDNVYETNWP